jgi:alginate O-acetyltransferase complex protein AlgI
MGYNFPDNFNHPYISTSLREFWTRWHISLSTWVKDYLYIPLGGGRVSKVRSHLNLWITMLVSGLWHGAAWTYVTWGAIHAFFSSVERITNWPEKLSKNTAARIIAWFFVTMQVLVAWIFFRANTVGQAWEIVKIMFSFVGDSNLGWGLNGTIFILIITLRELAVVTIPEKQFKSVKPIPEMLFYAVLITLIIYFRGEGSEFIYFQF